MLFAPVRPALAGTASEVIAELHSTLLAIMTAADRMRLNELYQGVAPRILAIFNIPYMMQVTVGRPWGEASEEERSKLVDAFARMSVLSYASRLETYAGERFEIVDEVESRSDRHFVRTLLTRPGAPSVPITYVTHCFGDGWRVVDVIFRGGISELELRRSEYSHTVRLGGLAGLIRRLNAVADGIVQRSAR